MNYYPSKRHVDDASLSEPLARAGMALLRLLALGIMTELLPGCVDDDTPLRGSGTDGLVQIIENENGYEVIPTVLLPLNRQPEVVGTAGYNRRISVHRGWIFPTLRRETRWLEVTFRDGRFLTRDDKAQLRAVYAKAWRATFSAGRVDIIGIERRDGYSNHWVWWGTLANGMVLLWSLTLVRAAYGRAGTTTWRASRSLQRFYEGFCPKCGYDLRQAPRRQCPECGLTWRPEDLPGHPASTSQLHSGQRPVR